MKALLTTGTGPLGIELGETPEPEQAPGQAVVQVTRMSVNRGDLAMASMMPAGSRIGWDLTGTVLRPAPDGSGPPEGARVLGLARRDGWAERVALEPSRMTVLADGASNDVAALPVAGLTALYALRAAGAVLGQTVLVTGASGGVGRLLLQLTSRSGARVLAVANRTDGLGRLGAHDVRTYGGAGDEPVDVVIDSVGGEVLTDAYRRIGAGGTLVSYGNTVREELRLPMDWGHARPGVVLRHLALFRELETQPVSRDLGFLAAEVAAGRLDPQVDRTAVWTDPSDALNALWERRVAGKVLLIV